MDAVNSEPMKVTKMNSTTVFLLLMLAIFLLASCTSQNTTTQKTQENAQQDNRTENNSTIKELFVEAFQFGYSPSELHVKEGDRVIIHLATRDVPHSLNIREFQINIPATPQKNGTGEFVASKKGTFQWNCRIPCGFGHSDMHGLLIVE